MRTTALAICALLVVLTGCFNEPAEQPSDAGLPDAEVFDAIVDVDAAVCTGNYTVTNQSDVDALSGCVSIEGSLNVTGTSLLELRLPQLVSVSEDVSIGNNAQLTFIDMRSLRTADSVGISQSPALTTVDFDQLDVGSGGALTISGTALTDLSGFRFPRAGSLWILDNDQLLTLGGGGTVSGDMVYITGNDSLVDLAVVESYFLEIVDNDSLTAIPDWPSALIGDGLLIRGNASLSAIGGLTQVNAICFLTIESNPILVDITSLAMLTEVPEVFTIRNNVQLPNCQAEALRDQLTNVGTVTIEGNDEVATCP